MSASATSSTSPPSPAASTAVKRRLQRESQIFAAIFSVMLFGLSLVLITWRSEQLLTQLAQKRVTRLVQQVAEEAEHSMRLGISIADQTTLPERLQRLQLEEPMILSAWMLDEHGQTLMRMGSDQPQASLQAHWGDALLRDRSGQRPSHMRTTSTAVLLGTQLIDSTGIAVAGLWIAFDPQEIRTQAHAAALDILLRSLPLVLLTFLLVRWALQAWSHHALESVQLHSGHLEGHQRSIRTLMTAGLLILVLAPIAMAWVTREATRPHASQQIQSNANATGHSLSAQISHALQIGIPWNGLNGVKELFEQQLSRAPELSYIDLRQEDGMPPSHISWGAGVAVQQRDQDNSELLHRKFPITERDNLQTGTLTVGYSRNFVDGQLRGMMVDLVLALVISAVLMRELTRSLWRRSLLFPLFNYTKAHAWQRVQQLWSRKHRISAHASNSNDVHAQECLSAIERALLRTPSSTAPHQPRALGSSNTLNLAAGISRQLTLLRLAVFLIALSEELLRPFFTVFASEVQSADSRLSPAMVAGMPIAAFMATLALTQIAGPTIARRFDLRWSLIAAALVGMMAMAATALADNIYALVALRALVGAAYGLGFIIAQTAIVRITPPNQRARGLAELSAAIVAAGIVGPPFGGMIAARAGDVVGFLACALCMATAMCVALRLQLDCSAGENTQRGLATTGGWRGYMAVLNEPRAIFVILGAALPARLAAVTVLSVVVPLYMSALGQPPTIAGRVLLLYFLCFASCSTLIAHWSDLTGQRKSFIVMGGLLSVFACFSLPLLGGVSGMAMCCALLGFGQALQSSPQIALATEAFEPRPDAPPSAATPEQALAAFRLIERLGSIVAPFVTAAAITLYGYAGAVVAVGLLVGIATMGLLTGLRTPRSLRQAA